MYYVLFVMLSAFGSDGGNVMTTSDYHTFAACQRAGEQIKKEFEDLSVRRSIKFSCQSKYN